MEESVCFKIETVTASSTFPSLSFTIPSIFPFLSCAKETKKKSCKRQRMVSVLICKVGPKTVINMKTIYQRKNLKQDRGNYKIVTGKFLTYSPLRGEDFKLKA